MSEQRRERITAALRSYLETAEPAAADELMKLVYDDLRRLASRLLRHERQGHTLSPTDLVHEAYTRLVDQTRVDWHGRTHFFAIAAQAMRRILIDHARKHGRTRRGGDWKRVTLDGNVAQSEKGLGPAELLALDAALTKLAAIDARQAQVVELRFFVGLSSEEIAEVLSVSIRSVTRDWLHARSWLRRELATPPDPISEIDQAVKS
jgi:RNA polymerase sigma factor (TIGR02999 family)